jgi:lipopolysaccharide/colanic/teichoic acid biosynthesis glycosyltransferase
MQWMTRLGSGLEYKIVPKESISIIGSSSKDAAGELYTIDIRFKIAAPMARRNKRVFDIACAFCCLLLVPVFLIFVKNRKGFLRNVFEVLFGKKSWVSYASHQSPVTSLLLPNIRKGVLSPLDALGQRHLDDATIQRLNFLYAKDYDVWRDLEVVWKGARELGR